MRSLPLVSKESRVKKWKWPPKFVRKAPTGKDGKGMLARLWTISSRWASGQRRLWYKIYRSKPIWGIIARWAATVDFNRVPPNLILPRTATMMIFFTNRRAAMALPIFPVGSLHCRSIHLYSGFLLLTRLNDRIHKQAFYTIRFQAEPRPERVVSITVNFNNCICHRSRPFLHQVQCHQKILKPSSVLPHSTGTSFEDSFLLWHKLLF